MGNTPTHHQVGQLKVAQHDHRLDHSTWWHVLMNVMAQLVGQDGFNLTVLEKEAAPLIFAPLVNLGRFEVPNIIDAFRRKAVFFLGEANKVSRNKNVSIADMVHHPVSLAVDPQ